jgi:serine/threonine protein kinase
MQKLEHIGIGGFGAVCKSYELANREREVVIKTMLINKYNTKEKEKLISLEREVAILKSCDHPNILKYLDSFRKVNGEAVIVTEYANLRSL